MTRPAPIGDALGRSLVTALGADCTSAALVARRVENHRDGPFDFTSLSAIPRGALVRITADFVQRGWLVTAGNNWDRGPNRMPDSLADFLEGAGQMRSVWGNDGRAVAVVTLPNAPSAVAGALPSTGMAHAGLVSTEHALQKVADAAVSTFVIASPFLNLDGLDTAIELFRRSLARSKRLICRCTNKERVCLETRKSVLLELNLDLLDYQLFTEDGFETFHAKVVIADQDLAYVGSANMTLYPKGPLELGVLVDGRAANVVASTVRAIEQISKPIVLTA